MRAPVLSKRIGLTLSTIAFGIIAGIFAGTNDSIVRAETTTATATAGPAANAIAPMKTEKGRLTVAIIQPMDEAVIKATLKLATDPMTKNMDAINAAAKQVLHKQLAKLKAESSGDWDILNNARNDYITAFENEIRDTLNREVAVFKNKITTLSDQAATKLKTELDAFVNSGGLALKFSSDYRYAQDQRVPANPGWNTPPSVRPGTVESVTVGALGYVTVRPGVSAIISVSVDIDIEVEVEVTAKLKAGDASLVQGDQPTAVVSATPIVELKVVVKAKVGAGAGVGATGGVILNMDLPDVGGQMQADGVPK